MKLKTNLRRYRVTLSVLRIAQRGERIVSTEEDDNYFETSADNVAASFIARVRRGYDAVGVKIDRIVDVTVEELRPKVEVRHVLAGAYRAGAPAAMLTHALAVEYDGTPRVLCSRVDLDSLSDHLSLDAPTCKSCAVALRKEGL